MKRRGSYTLIEVMVVMALAALLTAMALPAFSALMHGNSAAVTCSMIKGVLDQAQARAVTDRKFVATVIDIASESQSVRNCYVRESGTGYAFQSWVDGSDWLKLDQNAQILVCGLGGSGAEPAFPGAGLITPVTSDLATVTGVVGASNASLPGVVFSMYGNVKAPDASFYIGVGEATLANGVYIYKQTTGSGAPGNVMALKVNRFTGRSLVASLVSGAGTEKRTIE